MLKRLAVLAACLFFVSSAYAANYLVGMASRDITPTVPMRVFGYPGSLRMAAGGAYSGDQLGLTVRAVYIANLDGSSPIVLVAADLVNICPMDSEYARDPAHYGIPGLTRERIMINISHTHNAPSSCDTSVRVMDPAWQTDADPASAWRANTLRPKLVETIAAACASPAPANLRLYRNKAEIGINRRTQSTQDLTDANGTALADANGYDHTLDVVEIYGDDHSRKGVLFFYGAHPVTLGQNPIPDWNTGVFYQHPDYPGFARSKIESAGGGMAVFFQGAGGDVNAEPESGYSATKSTGETLGQRVLDMLAGTAPSPNVINASEITPSQGGITAYSRVWALPLETAVGYDHHMGGVPGQPTGIPTEAAAFGQLATADWGRWAAMYCGGATGNGHDNPPCELKSGVTPERSWDIEMQTLTIGKWRIAGFSHEPVSLQGLRIRQRWPSDWVSVVGYLGRTQNYLPTSAQIDADSACGCGYEGFRSELWNGHPAPWATSAHTGGKYDVDSELHHALYDPVPERVNYALTWNGSTAHASSELDPATRPASAAINGEELGINWGVDPVNGSGWHSQTANAFPQTLQVDFHADRTIDEIDVFSVQDDYQHPITPDLTTTFQYWGLTNFTVQYWDGAAWVTVRNGAVTNNNKVWVKLTFPPVTTTSILLTVTSAAGSYARVTELEAWGNATSRKNVALASNGATASASSVLDGNRAPIAAINGDRKGIHWGSDPTTGSGWHSQLADQFPQWLQVDFNGSYTIHQVNVIGVQDDFNNPVEPTGSTLFQYNGLVEYHLESWDGAQFVPIPGTTITGNTHILNTIKFTPLTTASIRVVVTLGGAHYARIAEVEALTTYDFLSIVP
jgi:F5/8 type C domain